MQKTQPHHVFNEWPFRLPAEIETGPPRAGNIRGPNYSPFVAQFVMARLDRAIALYRL
jgi:hypothetical protein